MAFGFGIDRERKPEDFYKRNMEEPVNLFTRGVTLSGDLFYYDQDKGIAILKNSIQRIYNSDGTSQFVEAPEEVEFDTCIVHTRAVATREDRLGRIAKYNQNLQTEEKRSANGKTLESPLKEEYPTE